MYLDPKDDYRVKCFLDKVVAKGLTWPRYNTNYLVDNTCVKSGYTECSRLKSFVQTECKGKDLKRELLMALRHMESESQSESESESQSQSQSEESQSAQDDDSDEKMKKYFIDKLRF